MSYETKRLQEQICRIERLIFSETAYSKNNDIFNNPTVKGDR